MAGRRANSHGKKRGTWWTYLREPASQFDHRGGFKRVTEPEMAEEGDHQVVLRARTNVARSLVQREVNCGGKSAAAVSRPI